MFRKLVSNLPFSPSLINQLSFYSKRLKKEQFTRKLGLIFTALALVVQTLTLLVPAQATLAANSNDIVYGGNGKSKAGIISAYAKNEDQLGRKDIQKIFNQYGIYSGNLNTAKTVKIQSTVKNNYWSIGRAPRGSGQELAVQINNGPKIYSRTLHGWAADKWWDALEINTDRGKRWIILECGNIVTQASSETHPDIKLEKKVDKPNAKKGEKVTFTLKATNIGDGIARNAFTYDDAPIGLDLVNDGLSKNISSARKWSSNRYDLAPGKSITHKIKAVVTKWGPLNLNNRACSEYFDVNIYNNCDTAKVSVPNGCLIPGKETLPADDPSCKTNPNLEITKTSSKKDLRVDEEFDYTLTVKNEGDVNLKNTVVRDLAPEEIEFTQVKEPGATAFTPVQNPRDYVSKTFGLNKGASITITLKAKALKANKEAIKNTACVLSTGNNETAGSCDDEVITVTETCPTNPKLEKDDPGCAVCPIEGKENLSIDDAGCKPCDESKVGQDGKDLSCLELHKKARNITQQLNDANGTKAKSGDTIEYTLSVKNSSKETRKGFVIEENMQDVLEYADIIDASGAQFTTSPVKMLSWTPVDIQPNETVTRTVLIKIKSEIPITPASTSDPLSYDMKLVNVYGDTVQISLPQAPIKTVEQTITTLPSTGLGTNVAISTVLIMSATYFYFRSRLMVKEVGLVKQQFNYGIGV